MGSKRTWEMPFLPSRRGTSRQRAAAKRKRMQRWRRSVRYWQMVIERLAANGKPYQLAWESRSTSEWYAAMNMEKRGYAIERQHPKVQRFTGEPF